MIKKHREELGFRNRKDDIKSAIGITVVVALALFGLSFCGV